MTSTLTIRLPNEQRQALKRRARALKTTESELIRSVLARELDGVPPGEVVAKWAGRLDSSASAGPARPLRSLLRERNWRR